MHRECFQNGKHCYFVCLTERRTTGTAFFDVSMQFGRAVKGGNESNFVKYNSINQTAAAKNGSRFFSSKSGRSLPFFIFADNSF